MRKLLIGALLCPFFSNCTPPANKPPLSVGDAFLPFTITRIINSGASSLFIPSVGNKVYILNFVSVGCSACLKDYPRLDSLQKAFGKKLQIILVTAETGDRVKRFLKETSFGQSLGLPVATADTLLASWFPHRFLSHTVWLQGGRVKGITTAEYINDNNIEILLMDRYPDWPVKKDDAEFNPADPLLKANGSLPAFLSNYSMFTPHLQGFVPALRQTKDSATASVKTTILNKTILESYLYAYGLPPNFPVSQISLNTTDTARYVYNERAGYKLDWDLDHTFCYESILPVVLSPESQKHKLLADLDFYFGLNSSLQKKHVRALALATNGNPAAKPLLTAGTWPQYISLSNLVYYLNHHWYGVPVTNETGITGKHYIPCSEAALASPETLRPWLAAYGLVLKPVEKELECLTLTETGTARSSAAIAKTQTATPKQ